MVLGGVYLFAMWTLSDMNSNLLGVLGSIHQCTGTNLQLLYGVKIEHAKEVGVLVLFLGLIWERVLPSTPTPEMKQTPYYRIYTFLSS